MFSRNKSLKAAVAGGLAAILLAGTMAPSFADDRHDRRDRRDHFDLGGDRHFGGPRHEVVFREAPGYYHYRPMPRARWYHNVYVYRPWGRPYAGYGFYYRDDDALRFLGLTALSFAAFTALSESQQRAHEQATIDAVNAPIGEPIRWDDGGSYGEVTATREGHTPDGRECREFQQDVVIGGKTEHAYGTACVQPDGAWKVVGQN